MKKLLHFYKNSADVQGSAPPCEQKIKLLLIHFLHLSISRHHYVQRLKCNLNFVAELAPNQQKKKKKKN